MKCGLLGEHLSHSWSPQIHAEFAGYEYRLYEKAPDEVEDFVRNGDWHGINVTIPYKKTVMPFCDELSPLAAQIGSVNTILRREDGTLYGDNTDAFGFEMLLQKTGFCPNGKKALVLGTGGASVTVQTVLCSSGAEVIPVSRAGKVNYGNIIQHNDAAIVVNTTPLGMYPNNGIKAVDLTQYPALEAVIDVIYNPTRTSLILQAESLGIPCTGGLRMLVGQAKRSSEIFLGREIPDDELERVLNLMNFKMQNIVIIGMPGCGKTTVAHLLAKKLSRPCMEADDLLEREAGKKIPEIFETEGEEGFRLRETELLRELGKQSGVILSTGGGCVTREENYPLLHQNGVIFRLTRDIKKLSREGRPLSENADLEEMAARREPFYARFADYTVDNNGLPEKTVDTILEALK